METIYYHLDAKQLTMYDLASGEGAPQPHSYTWIHREAPVCKDGKVLDFDAYRRKLAGEDAAAEGGSSAEPRQEAPVRAAGRSGLSLVLDLCASLAIVVMAAVVVSQFIRFF